MENGVHGVRSVFVQLHVVLVNKQEFVLAIILDLLGMDGSAMDLLVKKRLVPCKIVLSQVCIVIEYFIHNVGS